MAYTKPLEEDTRILINKSLENLGWKFEGKEKNVFLEQPKTEEEHKNLGGKRPDYVLYSNDGKKEPLIIIEAKKKGEKIDKALEQGIHYAKVLKAPIVFATDGLFCKSYHTKFDKTPILNGEEVDEFLREALALKYLNNWEVNTISPKVQYDRKELIKIFDEANNMLRGDGLRAGIERFGEFANILFLKLISESEDIKRENEIKSDFKMSCHWESIKEIKPDARIEYINKMVYKDLNKLYNTDIFTPLSIRDYEILHEIMEKLNPLKLTDVDSDVKGDAFEYFLKESASTKNDLGEYFTPRHIVKTMVRLVNPQIGEKIYDPFCGTGGFLIESFRHIWNTMPRTERTIKMLKEETIYGNEITNTARITKMNMILAGDGHSNIHMRDSLANPINMEYDVVLANMPYSQRTKHGNLYELPTTNGDSICVQHCMKAINATAENGRMAIVVPEGFLFSKDLEKTRELIMKNCNLQSIISLPQGVFLPYTGVKTNIIYATKINKKILSKERKKDFWYFEVKNDGYTLDNHRRKLNLGNDLLRYEEYRKLDSEQSTEMYDVGFEKISLDKVRENHHILVGSRYRDQKSQIYKLESRSVGDISTLIRGISFPKSAQKISGSEEDLKIITTKAAQSTGINEKDIISIDREYFNENKMLKRDDILISLANSINLVGRVTYVDKISKNLSFGAFMGVIRADKEKIIPKYLFYLLQSQHAKRYFSSVAKTTTNISNLTFEDLNNLFLPVPKREIQEQIVSELDKYNHILSGARSIVDNYIPTITVEDSWANIQLSDIVNEVKSGFACGIHNKNENGILHIRPMNITVNGNITLFNSKYIDLSILEKKEKFLLKKGDILFNNTNSKELVGKTCHVDEDMMALYSNHITRIRVNTDVANPKFIAIALHSIWRSGYFKELCRKWIGQAGIDLCELTSIQLKVPILEVQNQIVSQIEEEQKLIEPSKQLIEIFEKKINDKIEEVFK